MPGGILESSPHFSTVKNSTGAYHLDVSLSS
jgi:hypothetical protein